MKEILLKVKELLSEITVLDWVSISESDEEIPSSAVRFATVEENVPAETYEWNGLVGRHAYWFWVRVGVVTPAPRVETALLSAIDLSDTVRDKLQANRTLDGLVVNLRLSDISSEVSNIGGGESEDRFARARILRFTCWKYETEV